MICKNCKNTFTGNYCNNCGQSAKVRRIDLKYFLEEIPNSIFQVNSGFFFTIKELFIRPGDAIREFLEGKRKRYFKPLPFLLVLSTIYVVTTYLTGEYTFLGGVITGVADNLNHEKEKSPIIDNILNWLVQNHSYANLLILPFFSLASYLAFFKCKFNFFEHLVLNFYVASQQMLLYLIFTIVFFIFALEGYFIDLIAFFSSIVYLFYAFLQFFSQLTVINRVFRIFLTYIVYLILIAAAILVIMTV